VAATHNCKDRTGGRFQTFFVYFFIQQRRMQSFVRASKSLATIAVRGYTLSAPRLAPVARQGKSAVAKLTKEEKLVKTLEVEYKSEHDKREGIDEKEFEKLMKSLKELFTIKTDVSSDIITLTRNFNNEHIEVKFSTNIDDSELNESFGEDGVDDLNYGLKVDFTVSRFVTDYGSILKCIDCVVLSNA
jgi:hypothetical protein